MKRVLAVFLSVALVMGMCGCSLTKKDGIYGTLVNASTIETGKNSSKISIDLNKKKVPEAMASIAYCFNNRTMEGYEEESAFLEKEMEEYWREYSQNIPESIAISYEGKLDKEGNSVGSFMLGINDEKIESEIYTTKDSIYLNSEDVYDIIETLGEMLDELLIDSDTLKVLKSVLTEHKYIEIPLEEYLDSLDLNWVDEEDITPEQLKKISKPIDKMLHTYFAPFITKEKNGYAITIDFSTLQKNIKEVYKLIDKNPGKFFDNMVDIIVAAEDADLIDKEDLDLNINSFQDFLDTLKKLKDGRDEFIEDWNDFDYEDFEKELDEIFEDEFYQLIENSRITFIVTNNGKEFGLSMDVAICINNPIPVLNLTVESSMKQSKVESLKEEIKSLDSKTIDELDELLYANSDYYDLLSDYDDFDLDVYDDWGSGIIDYGISTSSQVSNTNETLIGLINDFANENNHNFNVLFSDYKKDFHIQSANVFSELNFEKEEDTIEATYASSYRSVYNYDYSNLYSGVYSSIYISDDYISVEHDIDINGLTSTFASPESLEALNRKIKTLYGIEIEEEAFSEILDKMTNDEVDSDRLYFSYEIGDIEYSIRYSELKRSGGAPLECNLSIGMNKYFGL